MKAKLSKTTQQLIFAAISLLGFSGCAASSKAVDSDVIKLDEDIIEAPEKEISVMYGPPPTLFYQEGSVKE